MNLLNEEYLNDLIIHKEEFQKAEPFPFINKKGIFKPGMRDLLLEELPDIPIGIDVVQSYVTLDINNIEMSLNDVWKSFIEDFKSDLYREFAIEFYGIKIDFAWHLQWTAFNNHGRLGVHTDTPRKLGTNLFYLNKDWKEEWGGRTTIIANFKGWGNFDEPSYNFKEWGDITHANMDEECIIFIPGEKSWHFVEPVTYPKPEEYVRRIFFINPMRYEEEFCNNPHFVK